MSEIFPFQIDYPVNILDKSKKINFSNKKEREKIFRRSLFYYKYKKIKNDILEERSKTYLLLTNEVLKFMNKNYPSLNVLNISIFGSSLFSEKPTDFDFLVIVEGNAFLLEETKIILNGHEYPVGISIKGVDNFSFGIFDLQSPTIVEQQNQIIDRTVISLFKRHIPIIGYDFIENKDIFINNIYAQVSDLLTNTYNLYFLKKEKLYLNDKQRVYKILSRLYEASSYLEFINKDSEVANIKKEIYLHYNKDGFSFLKSKKIFDKFRIIFINRSRKQKELISKKITFNKDNIEFEEILKRTNFFLSKRRIGRFLPVIVKIVDDKGKTIALSKRIKKSERLNRLDQYMQKSVQSIKQD